VCWGNPVSRYHAQTVCRLSWSKSTTHKGNKDLGDAIAIL